MCELVNGEWVDCRDPACALWPGFRPSARKAKEQAAGEASTPPPPKKKKNK